MKRIAVIGVLLTVLGSPALATWVGDTVQGVLHFGGHGSTNFFDPAIGYVPGGSSGIQPGAVVADPDGTFVEFMYRNGFSGINVDIDATSLLVHQFPVGGYDSTANSWDIYISGFDPDLTWAAGVPTIPNLEYVLLEGSNLLRISYPGGDAFGPTYYPSGWGVLLTLGSQPTVPAPGALLLGSLGAGLVHWMRRRKAL